MHIVHTWLQAFRLRTLPLALACIIAGSFLALARGKFSWPVLVFAALTTLFLQILSNLANDYGDAQHGVDNQERLGPPRVTQNGLVTRRQMRRMIAAFVLLALFSGALLILASFSRQGSPAILIFSLLGISAISAAVKYTIGKKPYGYVGLGDLFVFLYFGIAGVSGTFFLHTHSFDPWILLPAAAIGLLTAGVLNVNNMRDIENDARSGKRTLVVRIGSKAARKYHALLISLAMLLGLGYSLAHFDSVWRLLFVVTVPLFIRNVGVVLRNAGPAELNGELKKLALSTFLFSVMFGLGMVL